MFDFGSENPKTAGYKAQKFIYQNVMPQMMRPKYKIVFWGKFQIGGNVVIATKHKKQPNTRKQH